MDVLKTILCELTGYALRTVDVSRGDNHSRSVACRLMANGEPWEVPEGARADVAYTLPNGTPGRYSVMPDGSAAATIDGSTVTVRLLDRIMAEHGAVSVSVVLTDGTGAQLATFPFRVNVIGGNKLRNPETYPALGAEYEGMLLFGGPGGVVTPLKLGPGLSIRDGILYVSGGSGEPGEPEEPLGVVEAFVDEDGDLHIYLDGVEVVPVLDGSGDLTWPGLAMTIDSGGNATLTVKEA